MDINGLDKDKTIQQLKGNLGRVNQHLNCALQWLRLLESGAGLVPYFQERDCKKLAIYGIGEFGRLLQKEVSRSNDMEVVYFMDRRAEKIRKIEGISVFLPQELEIVPEADMIVVSAMVAFPAISKTLLELKPELPIVSLKNILEARIVEEWIWS